MEKLKKLKKLTKAEMKKITAGGNCSCASISCEWPGPDHTFGGSIYATDTSCGQAAQDLCDTTWSGTIVVGCDCVGAGFCG